jgi:hypothetical protein
MNSSLKARKLKSSLRKLKLKPGKLTIPFSTLTTRMITTELKSLISVLFRRKLRPLMLTDVAI